MSIYVTLLSPQGSPNKFTAKLPYFLYLTEKDWEVALVKLVHPVIEDIFWTINESRRNTFSFRFNNGTTTKSKMLRLSSRKIDNFKQLLTSLAFEIEKVNGEELTKQAALAPYDETAAKTLLSLPRLKITNHAFLDGVVIHVPKNNLLSMSRTFAGKANIVTSDGQIGKNLAIINTAESSINNLVRITDQNVDLGSTNTDAQFLIGPNMSTDLGQAPKEQESNKRIFLMSDIVQPQIVGDTTKGLLKEFFIFNTASTHYFEPDHLIHLPVRKTVFDSIDIELNDDQFNLVDFHHSHSKELVTSITLWFTRRSLRQVM